MQMEEVLMFWHRLTPWSIVLHQRGIEGDLLCATKMSKSSNSSRGCCVGKQPVSRRKPS
jgi:hypothetical protein